MQLEGLRPQSTASPWSVVDESAGIYTYTYSRNAGVGGQMVTLPVKTLAAAQHTGSYSVTLSADGDNGVPVYRETEKANGPRTSTNITFTNSSATNTTTSGNVSVSFANAGWNSNAVRFKSTAGGWFSSSTPGYMEVSVPDGYSMTGITFSFSQGARDLSVSTGTFSRSGNNVTWTSTGPTTVVQFTNTATGNNDYVYIKTINVEYIKLED